MDCRPQPGASLYWNRLQAHLSLEWICSYGGRTNGLCYFCFKWCFFVFIFKGIWLDSTSEAPPVYKGTSLDCRDSGAKQKLPFIQTQRKVPPGTEVTIQNKQRSGVKLDWSTASQQTAARHDRGLYAKTMHYLFLLSKQVKIICA